MAMSTARTAGSRRSKWINGLLVNGTLALICFIWIIPLVGLLVSSFRERSDIATSGWWTVLPHRAYNSVEQIDLGRGFPVDQPIQLDQLGVAVTDDQLRAGYTLPDGRRLQWANRRARIIDVQAQEVTANANFTTSNYQNVLLGQRYTYTLPDGSTRTEQGENMGRAFLNSLTVAIPATVIPILLAAFAAYAFAWMRFPRAAHPVRHGRWPAGYPGPGRPDPVAANV
jgi:alpha-glucoside transport system permease protein